MASVLLRPSVVSFLDIASRSSDQRLRVEQMRVPETSSAVGKTLAELRIPHETGLVVVAVRKDHERGSPFVFNPSASTLVEAGDDVIVLGDEEQIQSLRAYLS
jgi:voltage-gated potassium channel